MEPQHDSADLLPDVYDDLRKLARGMMQSDGLQTLSATALVHEAWLRVSKSEEPQWENRRHFFGAAARATTKRPSFTGVEPVLRSVA